MSEATDEAEGQWAEALAEGDAEADAERRADLEAHDRELRRADELLAAERAGVAAETPIDRAGHPMTSAEREARDRALKEAVYASYGSGGGHKAIFDAGVKYARGATVAEIVEWLRAKSRFSSHATEAFVYPEVADAIEARFSPAAPTDPCTECDGRGHYTGWPHTTCPTCKGTGAAPPEREEG